MSLIVDHWLSYFVTIALACFGYRNGYLNRHIGCPWEYHSVFAGCLLGHCMHELYWFTRLGAASANLPYWNVAKGAIVGPLSNLDYYLDCQFIGIAWLFSRTLAYWSLSLFVL